MSEKPKRKNSPLLHSVRFMGFIWHDVVNVLRSIRYWVLFIIVMAFLTAWFYTYMMFTFYLFKYSVHGNARYVLACFIWIACHYPIFRHILLPTCKAILQWRPGIIPYFKHYWQAAKTLKS